MLAPHAGDDRISRPPVTRPDDPPLSAALRLGAHAAQSSGMLVLAEDRLADQWTLLAATAPLPADLAAELARHRPTLADGPVRVLRGRGLALPLLGSSLLGVLVLLDEACSIGHDVLSDLRRCLCDALEATAAREAASLEEQSAAAVRRLFVEGALAQNVREAGTVLARVAADAFGTERAGMFVIDDEGVISFAVGVGVSDELSRALSASLTGKIAAQSPVWKLIENIGGAYLVDDARNESKRPGGFLDTMQLVSYAAIPLMSADGALGMVVCGESSRLRRWTPREHDLAVQFALEAALIIDAARLRTAQRDQLAQLSHHAHHDGLTGLPNRRLLMSRLDDVVDQAAGAQSSAAVLLLDLNDFKQVNDTLGHRFGDELLCAVASRRTAVVSPGDTLARLGGDEFAVLLPRAGRAEAMRYADRVRAALAEPILLDGVAVNAVASLGIALLPDHSTAPGDLLQFADVAMYSAKRSGRPVAVYERSMNDATVDRLALYAELRQAIDGGELRLHHQPKLDLRTGAVVGVESLVRWQHPRRGLLAPADFLPLAESSDLIHPLTAWVVENAISQQRSWSQGGLDLDVSVNFSARNLMDADLNHTVCDLLLTHGAAARFVVEVTETSVMIDTDQSIRTLAELRDLGVRISMDDFGTGQSSLALLSRLPVDELKLDRQLVRNVAESARDRALLATSIHLGHQLGLEVVGEGIETPEVLDVLRELGCDLAQGYLISRPVEADEVALSVQDWQDPSGRRLDRSSKAASG